MCRYDGIIVAVLCYYCVAIEWVMYDDYGSIVVLLCDDWVLMMGLVCY